MSMRSMRSGSVNRRHSHLRDLPDDLHGARTTICCAGSNRSDNYVPTVAIFTPSHQASGADWHITRLGT